MMWVKLGIIGLPLGRIMRRVSYIMAFQWHNSQEVVRSTPGVIPELIQSQGWCCPWCTIECWYCWCCDQIVLHIFQGVGVWWVSCRLPNFFCIVFIIVFSLLKKNWSFLISRHGCFITKAITFLSIYYGQLHLWVCLSPDRDIMKYTNNILYNNIKDGWNVILEYVYKLNYFVGSYVIKKN